MPLPERTTTGRRLALGAAVILVALIIVAVIVRGVFEREQPVEPAPPTGEPAARPLQIDTPPLPIPPPPLSRGDLIGLATRAASAHSTGQALSAEDVGLIGRNFVVRIPFGCQGPVAENQPRGAYWRHDAARGSMTLRAYPEIWTETPWVGALAGPETFDAVEGFWLPRPWITSEDCPKPAAAASEPAPIPAGEQTLGLAMFFEPGSSRVHRRGSRPYEFVGKTSADAPIAPQGFRLVLAGRITGFDQDEPLRCRSEGGRRPVCLIAVEFDQVAFEDPATRKTLAEWRMN